MVTYEVIVPEDVVASVKDKELTVKGKLGELTRRLPVQPKQDGSRLLFSGADSKRSKSLLGTAASHAENMISGVTSGFRYQMKLVYAHFPINIIMQGNQLVVKNFLGEKSPRFARIETGVKVEVKGQDVSVTGIDVNAVGQTIANIESATRVTKRDTRVFQDGIYLTSRG
ncbi:50S ribosomal protein L6 [Candidatus Micrarchaeota archaeon]|nr:50S ribosomal protein L6 [Candidatus Micrarchaeota archaeon]